MHSFPQGDWVASMPIRYSASSALLTSCGGEAPIPKRTRVWRGGVQVRSCPRTGSHVARSARAHKNISTDTNTSGGHAPVSVPTFRACRFTAEPKYQDFTLKQCTNRRVGAHGGWHGRCRGVARHFQRQNQRVEIWSGLPRARRPHPGTNYCVHPRAQLSLSPVPMLQSAQAALSTVCHHASAAAAAAAQPQWQTVVSV